MDAHGNSLHKNITEESEKNYKRLIKWR
jgi:hypothetical protein